jgi:hypothetical protein
MWQQARLINRILATPEPDFGKVLHLALGAEPNQDVKQRVLGESARETHVGFLCAPIYEKEIVQRAEELELAMSRTPASVLSKELGVQATILELVEQKPKEGASRLAQVEVIFVRSSAAPFLVQLMAELGRAAHWAVEVTGEPHEAIAALAERVRDASAQSWMVPAFSEEPVFSPQKGVWLYYMDDGSARLEITAKAL